MQTTMGDLIARNARCFPDKIAYIDGDRRVTWAGFADRARRLASGLYHLGLRRQERVSFLGVNCMEYCEFFSAAEVAGYIAAPLNFRLAAAELEYQVKDSGPRIIIFQEQYAAVVAELRARFTDVAAYVCIGDQCPSWAHPYERVLLEGSPAGPPIRSTRDDFVYLWYTSGTTGRPKGVPIQQYKVLGSAQLQSEIGPIPGDSVVLQVTPMFHVGGRGYVYGAMWSGATVVIDRGFDARRMLETIQRERVTFTFMVAAMVQALLDVPDVKSYDLSSMRKIISAAAPIPVPLLKRAIELLGPIFGLQYGSTEVGQITNMPGYAVNPHGTADQIRRLGSAGQPVPHIEFKLLDDNGQECPPGKPGEVVVRSDMMFDRYWNNSVATLESIRDGWYYTGDIGMADQEGYIFLVDRKKDMIISGGENIYCREVEMALAEHAAVADVAVVGVPDPKWVEAVQAVVRLKAGAAATEADLIAHCRGRIAHYKCPKYVDFAAELPRLPSGKINKVELRARYRAARG